jgi:hypothetical protein
MFKPKYDSPITMLESKPRKHKTKPNKSCKKNFHNAKKIVTTTNMCFGISIHKKRIWNSHKLRLYHIHKIFWHSHLNLEIKTQTTKLPQFIFNYLRFDLVTGP